MAEVGPHNMTANNAPTPWVASAISEYNASYAAYHAFDSAEGNGRWASASAAAGVGWLKLDFGEGNSATITSYSVQVENANNPSWGPRDWYLEGSDDDSTWARLDTVTNQTLWTALETRSFNCDVTTTGYRYIRINITANQNPNSDGLSIQELSLTGTVAGGNPSGQPTIKRFGGVPFCGGQKNQGVQIW